MKQINRRDFLKTLGLAGATATGVSLASCSGKKASDIVSGTVEHSTVPTDKMTYRQLGKDKVSLLGYGCMRWPMKDGEDGKQIVDQEQVQALIDYAMAHGINYYDTSPHYCQGQSETAVGLAMQKYPRDSYFLATKMSTFLDHCDNYETANKEELQKSLVNLKTNYLDYYLIHGAGIGGMATLHERLLDPGTLDWLEEQRQKGVIRNLGFSFHGEVEVFDYLMKLHDEGTHKWDFVQIQMNYSDWKHATGWNVNGEYLYGELEKRGIPTVIMEPLLGGRLAKLPNYLMRELKQRRPEESVASWAFRFCASHKDVMAVLSGMTYMENLQDNLCTFSPLDPCTPEEYDLLEHTAVEYLKNPIIECNSCNYCMPCPYGVDIPTILTYYNKLVNEQMMASSVNDENYKELRRAFLVGYDRAVPALRQADHCIGCNQCRSKCPQWIDIAGNLQMIDKYVEGLKQDNLGLEEKA